jgi:hypothetical protein
MSQLCREGQFLLVEVTRVTRDNHRLQVTDKLNVYQAIGGNLYFSCDCTGVHKFNYHTITATTIVQFLWLNTYFKTFVKQL